MNTKNETRRVLTFKDNEIIFLKKVYDTNFFKNIRKLNTTQLEDIVMMLTRKQADWLLIVIKDFIENGHYENKR